MRASTPFSPSIIFVAGPLIHASAHGPEVELSELRVIPTDQGYFLEVRVDPPDVADPLALTAVATGSEAAQLERRSNEGYRVVESASIARGHSENRLGVFTLYRIRLPEVDRNDEAVPLTLLFTDGVLLQRQAAVEGGAPSRFPWLWVVLLLGLLAFIATLTSHRQERRRNGGALR
jgi:hypothetical protein